MPLLGPAAMLLSFDVAPDAIAEHDHWHTYEHLPERLSIPGFLRGSRWIARTEGAPRYTVLYEVESVGTLSSEAYLARLNAPTRWTSRMMPHYRGMRRGLCAVLGSFGYGLGHLCASVRFAPREGSADALYGWLLQELLPALVSRPGLCSAHLLQRAATAAMTSEQRIRGADASVDSAVLVTGHVEAALADLMAAELGAKSLEPRGAASVEGALYRMDATLSQTEMLASR